MKKSLFTLAAALLIAGPAHAQFTCQGEGTYALTASTDNLDLGKNCVAKVTAPSAMNITGIVAGNPGRLLVLYNTGSSTITLSDASTSSTYGNRFTTYGASTENVALPAGAGVLLFYDAGSASWRLAAPPSTEILTFTTLTVSGDLTVTGTTTATGDLTANGGAGALTVPVDGTAVFGTNGLSIGQDAGGTPDQSGLWVGTISEGILIAQVGDKAYDFAHADQTNPTLWIQSATQSATQWISLTHDQTNGLIDVGTGVVNIPDGVTTAGNLVTTGSGTMTIAGLATLTGGASAAAAVNTSATALGFGSTTANTGSFVPFVSAQTVDTSMLLTGTTSNHFVLAEVGDVAFDFAHAQTTNPTLFVHSATQGTTEWISLTHNATNGVLDVGAGLLSIPDAATVGGALIASSTLAVTSTSTLTGNVVQGTNGTRTHSGRVTLTEAGGAETVLTVTNADTEITGGTLTYSVRIQDTAATPDDNDIRIGHFQFGLANSAGVVICTADASDQTNDDSHIVQQGVAKTITYAIAATAGTNTCVISFNLDSDMATVTGASIQYELVLTGPGTIS